MNYYEHWNNYKIGKVRFIKGTKNHPVRKFISDKIINDKSISSVIEIGPGELLEYQNIIEKRSVKYSVVDVSDTFLDNCKNKFPEINRFKSSMELLDSQNIETHDLVFLVSVLEHSSDIALSIKNTMKLSKEFCFVMFKWKYDSGISSLLSKKKSTKYKNKFRYWSSYFGIYDLIDIIEQYGHINNSVVVKKEGGIEEFSVYSEGLTGNHRNGNYLVLSGTCNGK